MPVNMRRSTRWTSWANYFGLVFLSLPIGIDNPFERLYEIQKRMGELKNSYEAVLALGLLAVCGMAPNVVRADRAGPVDRQGHRGDDQCAGAERADLSGRQ